MQYGSLLYFTGVVTMQYGSLLYFTGVVTNWSNKMHTL
jgi:hypothetical protein